MKSFEEKTHSFIVRVWLEPREIAAKKPEWRGVIEHVTNGKRQYLSNLCEIQGFIKPYVESMGVRFSRIREALGWLKICVFGARSRR